MKKVLDNKAVEDVLNLRLPTVEEFQKCSFILPNGKFLKLEEHYEAFKFLVVEGLSPSIPDAELLLAQLGWVRYSWIGYMTLPFKQPTQKQYKTIEMTLIEISKVRDEISIQLQANPTFYMNFQLDDIPNIIDKIKKYYEIGTLLP